MAGNPFSIQPINTQPLMQGISTVLRENRDENKKELLRQELQTGIQGTPQQQMALMAKYPEMADKIKGSIGFANDLTSKAVSEGAIPALSYLNANTAEDGSYSPEVIQQAQEMLVRTGQEVARQGGNPENLARLAEGLSTNPAAALSGLNMMAYSSNPDAYKAMLGSGKENVEFLKEERKNAAQDVRSFNTQAKEMRSTYGKLAGLAEQAEGGNRGARNAMVVSLARLISPGIVTETEASALSGGQNTMQAVIQGLTGKGIDTQALLRSFDPYGETFDAEGLLKVGESVVASSRKPLLDMYESSRDRATRAKMGKRAFDTNFGDNKNYDFLTSFDVGAQDAPVQQNAAPEGTVIVNPETKAKMRMTNGAWQPI